MSACAQAIGREASSGAPPSALRLGAPLRKGGEQRWSHRPPARRTWRRRRDTVFTRPMCLPLPLTPSPAQRRLGV